MITHIVSDWLFSQCCVEHQDEFIFERVAVAYSRDYNEVGRAQIKAYYSNAETGRKVSDRRGLPSQVSHSTFLMTKFIIFGGTCVFTMPCRLPSKSAVNCQHFVYFKM